MYKQYQDISGNNIPTVMYQKHVQLLGTERKRGSKKIEENSQKIHIYKTRYSEKNQQWETGEHSSSSRIINYLGHNIENTTVRSTWVK